MTVPYGYTVWWNDCTNRKYQEINFRKDQKIRALSFTCAVTRKMLVFFFLLRTRQLWTLQKLRRVTQWMTPVRLLQKGNALTGPDIYTTRDVSKDAAWVFIKWSRRCLILGVGLCPCSGRPLIFLQTGFSLQLSTLSINVLVNFKLQYSHPALTPKGTARPANLQSVPSPGYNTTYLLLSPIPFVFDGQKWLLSFFQNWYASFKLNWS